MKRKGFSVKQIVAAPKRAERGVPVGELIRHAGISEQTFQRSKRRSTALEIDQVRQLRQLQDKARLRRLVAYLTLDKVKLQDVLEKILRVVRRCNHVHHLLAG